MLPGAWLAGIVFDAFFCRVQNVSAAPADAQPRPVLTGGPAISSASSSMSERRVPTPGELSMIRDLRCQLGQATQDLRAIRGKFVVANSKATQAAAREQYLLFEMRSLSSELEG